MNLIDLLGGLACSGLAGGLASRSGLEAGLARSGLESGLRSSGLLRRFIRGSFFGGFLGRRRRESNAQTLVRSV